MKRLYSLTVLGIYIVAGLLIPGGWSLHAQNTAADLLGRINTLRAELGRAPYSTDPALTAAAQNHAAYMASTGNVSHVQENGSTVRDRAQAAGYPSDWVSENIYMGPIAGVNDAWNFWLNSAIHYRGMTSTNYSHIGIASVSGANGEAFVLVFGNPGSYDVPQAAGNAGGSQSSQAQGPPPFFKGVDAVGNLMHEIQPGDTLGDIVLYYGYTWDDIPQILALNEMTEADIRTLKEGEILLVPPQDGTYTPTPAPAAADATPAAEIMAAQITAVPETVVPQSTSAEVARSSDGDAGIIATQERNDAPPGLPVSSPTPATTITAESALLPPVQYDADNPPTAIAPTAIASSTPAPVSTPTPLPPTDEVIPTEQSVAAINAEMLTPAQNRAVNSTADTPVVQNAMPRYTGPPLWLLAAIIVQVGILAFASFEFIRRWMTR